MAQIVSTVIEGINEKAKCKLPKYVAVIIDKDLIETLHYCDFGLNHLLEKSIAWIFHNISCLFKVQCEDLHAKRAGAITSAIEPTILWVKMLK